MHHRAYYSPSVLYIGLFHGCTGKGCSDDQSAVQGVRHTDSAWSACSSSSGLVCQGRKSIYVRTTGISTAVSTVYSQDCRSLTKHHKMRKKLIPTTIKFFRIDHTLSTRILHPQAKDMWHVPSSPCSSTPPESATLVPYITPMILPYFTSQNCTCRPCRSKARNFSSNLAYSPRTALTSAVENRGVEIDRLQAMTSTIRRDGVLTTI